MAGGGTDVADGAAAADCCCGAGGLMMTKTGEWWLGWAEEWECVEKLTGWAAPPQLSCCWNCGPMDTCRGELPAPFTGPRGIREGGSPTLVR